MLWTPTSGKTWVWLKVAWFQLASVALWQRLAGRRESGGGVLRGRGGVVLGLVAAEAVLRRARVDVVLVAGGAGLGVVDADQREDLRVVEGRLVPVGVGGFVAALAGRREARGGVLRAGRGVVLGLVAAEAVPRGARVDVVPVAGGARLSGMDADEGVDQGVIERRLVPVGVGGPVAVVAGGREAGGRVLGVRRRVVLGLVAAEAVARRTRVDVVPVAGGAGLSGVDADEREALVGEWRAAPVRIGRSVAVLAGRRKSGGGVVGIARGVVVRLVTRRALRVEPGEDLSAVAGFARQAGVRGAEREPGPLLVVPVDGVPSDRPVAVAALVAEPGLVLVVLAADPVAVVAPVGRALEDAVEVALGARGRQVLAFEREDRVLVKRARSGLPGLERVAALALFAERSVVGVLVTGRALRRHALEDDGRAGPVREGRGPRLVALRAGERPVLRGERTPPGPGAGACTPGSRHVWIV